MNSETSQIYQLALAGVQALIPYQPGKPMGELERELGLSRIVKLASNENPKGPSEKVLSAVREVLTEASRYPDGNGFSLKTALAKKLAVATTQITLGNGSNDVLEIIARTFLSEQCEVIFSEYGNNLIYNNPHFLFNLGLGHNNFSIFPLIPFVGILFTIGGILSIFPNIFQKKIIGIIFGIFGSLFLVLFLTENLEKYFLAAIIFPIIIMGLISKNKINSNTLSLLIMSTIFMILISIINIKTPHDILAVSIIPIAFSSYFIIKIVPKIFVKIRNKTNTKITNYFLVLMIIMIILMNIPLSIMVQKNLLYGENIDYKNLFENKKYTHTAVEYEEVGIYLSKINGIQNKIIMASERDYAHYANSKFVFTSFNEGKETDTINEFINRDNWSKYEIIESNMASQPPDRKNEHNHQKADYIIIQKNMAINNNIEILKNKNDPKIPTNIELVYESNSNQTLVYKINHN